MRPTVRPWWNPSEVCLLPDQCGGDQHVVAAGRLTAHEEAVATVGGPKVGDRGRRWDVGCALNAAPLAQSFPKFQRFP